MERWSLSNDRYEKEAAESCGLARHMFLSVLPNVLSKSYNRNYGPLNHEKPNGAIIPYQGPDAPAKTKFGYVYLSLASHLQAALGGGVAEAEIQFLASKMFIAAQNFANKENIGLLETLEAKQFLELTGIELNEVSIPERLKTAHAYINDPEHPERCLKIRQEVAPFHVRYYPHYVSSNPINFVEHIARPIACSGTKWNHTSFHPKLGKMTPDWGAEGAIIDAIEKRDHASSSIHGVPEASLESLLEVIRKHPNKQRVRSFIDGGGFLKGFARGSSQNQSKIGGIHPNVSRLLQFFKDEPQTSIQGVFYLHRFSADEIEKGLPEEAFVIAKEGQSGLIILENTRPEAVAKGGIPLENLFFLIDELQGTGLDCVIAPDTIFLLTIDLDAPVRTLLQNSQRAREFFKKQHIEYCITNKGINTVLHEKKTMAAVNRVLEINESRMISDFTLRSYILQLPNIPRAHVIRELCGAACNLDDKKIESLTDKFSEYLVTIQGDEKLWVRFGRVDRSIPTVDFLRQRREQLLEALTEKDDGLASKFKSDGDTLLKNAEEEVMLPGKVEIQAIDKLDKEVEIVLEADVELDLDEDLSLNEELNQELHQYNETGENKSCYVEKSWEITINKTALFHLTN